MEVFVENPSDLGNAAARAGARLLIDALSANETATVVFATGSSQFALLDRLVTTPGIDWNRVTGFHLDEYLGLPTDHPASFRTYLKDRLVDRVSFGAFHYVNGKSDPAAECQRLGNLLCRHTIDVAFVGIGENAHLAFNDPPADFESRDPFLVVPLDERCRSQQVREGWFRSLEDVPVRAITMSIRQIMAARAIVCTVPEARKAEAVRAALQGPISPDVAASILREHPRASIFLDSDSASLLSSRPSDRSPPHPRCARAPGDGSRE